MYNEKLEALITAALADGVLTEKEKQILFKKAEAMGIDRDEFELVLDGRLAKRKEEMEAQAPQAAKSAKKEGAIALLAPLSAIQRAEHTLNSIHHVAKISSMTVATAFVMALPP